VAIKNHGPTSLLGFTPGLGTWYGGKVSFTMRLQEDKKGSFQFILESPTLAPSSRFTRIYGSSWLIRVKLATTVFVKLDKLKRLLLRPLILNGQVFRFFYTRNVKTDVSVYLMATNELYDGSIKLQSPLNGQRVSFLEFFSTHNNLQDNCDQVGHLLIRLIKCLLYC
jgi:RNA-dependent RNA polymerase